MSEWKEVKLGEITDSCLGKMLDAKKNRGIPQPYLANVNVRWGSFDLEDLPLMRFEESENERYGLKFGDIVVCEGGEPGRCAIWKDQVPNMKIQKALHRVRCHENVDYRFLYYYLLWAGQKGLFDQYCTGSTIKHLPGEKLKLLPISLPPPAEQRRIAEILGALDDKIELNSAINRNLEEQARALFKNWFIDFAPFGGNMPGDWKETTLGDVCLKVTDGSHFSPQDDPTAPYPMYSVKDMETYGFNSNDCKHISAEDFEKMKAGDCVPRVDDILVAKDGSYLKEIFICSEKREEAILSSIAIFRPDKKKILPEILLFLLKQPSVRKNVGDNFVSGSALPRIVLKDFKKYQFILPSIKAQQDLAKMLNSIRKQIQNNVDENQRLTPLRDTLLPKLMNGKQTAKRETAEL